MEGHRVDIERTYDAPAEKVFDAWTSEEVLRRWWRAAHRFEVSEAEVDPRVGGRIRLTMHDPDNGADHGAVGTYTEFDRPNRLAFTWLWDRDGDDESRNTLIQVDFREELPGRTTVSFSHTKLWSAEVAKDHEGGWNGIFDRLGDYLNE